MKEEWRDIPQFEGHYQVSSDGRVRSIKKDYLILKPGRSGRGYLSVNLWKNNVCKKVNVHTLVLTVFVGKRPEGLWARHLNGNGFDNRLSNLKWDTPKKNQRDKVKHGTLLCGEKHYNVKLSKKDVIKLRKIKSEGKLTYTELGKMFNVDRMTCFDAVTGRTWKHI